MALSPLARWILASLISIGLQLCCCNAEVLFNGCCGGQAHPQDAAVALADSHDHAYHSHREHGGHDDGDHHHDNAPSQHDDGQPTKPCGPCDHHNNGGCSCGTHDKAPGHIEQLYLPVTVVAILPAPVVLTPTLLTSASRYAELHGVFPPQTSLLQQHCALIV